MITIERLKELVSYDPATGDFTQLTATGGTGGSRRNPGDKAGYLDVQGGYWRLTLDGTQYQAHVMAVFYMTGTCPNYSAGVEVDHKDRIKTNNVWSNLRIADKAKNRQNIPAYANNKLGIKGVCQISSGRFIAQLKVNKKYYRFGPFDTAEEASAAYNKAKAELHTFTPVLV